MMSELLFQLKFTHCFYLSSSNLISLKSLSVIEYYYLINVTPTYHHIGEKIILN